MQHLGCFLYKLTPQGVTILHLVTMQRQAPIMLLIKQLLDVRLLGKQITLWCLGNEDVTAVYMGEDSGATVYAASFVGDGSQLTGITGSASSLNDLTDVLVDSNSMFLGNPPTNSTGGYNTASGRNALNSNTTGE